MWTGYFHTTSGFMHATCVFSLWACRCMKFVGLCGLNTLQAVVALQMVFVPCVCNFSYCVVGGPVVNFPCCHGSHDHCEACRVFNPHRFMSFLFDICLVFFCCLHSFSTLSPSPPAIVSVSQPPPSLVFLPRLFFSP